MHSADYAVADVCPSVPLSHLRILSKWLNISSKFFHRWVKRRRRMQGGMKNHDFRPKSRFISEMMQDRATVTMKGK